MKIGFRLVMAVWLVAVLGTLMLVYQASAKQRELAIQQAREMAESIHQTTLAGATAMMITGTISQRAVFLDQIRRSRGIADLRLIRSELVTRQFGPGVDAELPRSPDEHMVLSTGRSSFKTISDPRGEWLRVILPAVAQKDYLGKNCISCHEAREGDVLGALTMDISLESVNAGMAAFRQRVLTLAVLGSALMAILFFFFVRHLVSSPIRQLTEGLENIAERHDDLGATLPVGRRDEIGEAAEAFNRVMERAQESVAQERLTAEIFNHSLAAMTITDAQPRIQRVNAAFTQITGYTQEEVAGRNPNILQSGRHDDGFYRNLWESLARQGQWEGEIWNRRKNGDLYPEWLSITSIRNGRGEITNYLAVFTDITARKRAEAAILRQAFHDPLTGLPNRSLLRERLETAAAASRQNPGTRFALMFLDLDRFKEVNDTLGHEAGDQLLKQVAGRLSALMRESDTVARLAGDEFVVLLPSISSLHDAEVVGAKLVEAMTRPFNVVGHSCSVTTSVGVAIYPDHGSDPEILMKNADHAMYQVKQGGRSGYRIFSPPASDEPYAGAPAR